MKEYALYFMPDISGFTNFVTSTEIEHSKHIISELLEILLDNNIIELKLVEIEGDALFMYTTDFPLFSELLVQSKKMLNAFSEHIQRYNTSRICECGACVSAQDLKIKFLIHYGEISFMRVKDIVKPYGADVIKIHRLLKNSIPSDQYLLISQSTLDFYKEEESSISEFTINEDVYDHGISQYAFTELKPIAKPSNIEVKLTSKPSREPEINFNIEISGDINKAINYISDLRNRTKWYKLINNLEFDDFRINQAKTIHQCIVGSNVVNVETLKWELNTSERGYGERTYDMPNIDDYQYYITLQQKNQTLQLNLEVFVRFSKSFQDREKTIMFLKEAWLHSIFELKIKLNNLSS
ncbi:MAG: DUF2652 domain-containing protein [Winogradskyella sp.]|nr:MAG: DUF2652 domain-containing protein [Winogradskyella sp.]